MLKKLCITAALLILPCSCFAISETNFDTDYASKVAPFYNSGTFGEFTGKNDLRINYVAFEQAHETGALVIMHGKSESYIKYAELVYDLQDLGLSCYLMDDRGFGFSERILTDDPEKVYVDTFEDYVADTKTFIDTIVKAKPHERIFILAHSMGGCIAARFLEQYPDDITAAVLTSPMLQIDTGSFPPAIAYTIATLATALGHGRDYAIGQGPLAPDADYYASMVTHSVARFSKWEYDLMPDNPEIISGGATYNWIKTSMAAGVTARKQARGVKTPLLLLQAEEDWYVENRGEDSFCDRADDCYKIFMFGSRHEILMETDTIRDLALNNIRSFLEKFMK